MSYFEFLNPDVNQVSGGTYVNDSEPAQLWGNFQFPPNTNWKNPVGVELNYPTTDYVTFPRPQRNFTFVYNRWNLTRKFTIETFVSLPSDLLEFDPFVFSFTNAAGTVKWLSLSWYLSSWYDVPGTELFSTSENVAQFTIRYYGETNELRYMLRSSTNRQEKNVTASNNFFGSISPRPYVFSLLKCPLVGISNASSTVYQLAFYDDALTDEALEENYQAWLPVSTPPVAYDCNLFAYQYVNTSLTLENCFSDFDRDNGPSTGPCSPIFNITIISLPDKGKLYANISSDRELTLSDLPYSYWADPTQPDTLAVYRSPRPCGQGRQCNETDRGVGFTSFLVRITDEDGADGGVSNVTVDVFRQYQLPVPYQDIVAIGNLTGYVPVRLNGSIDEDSFYSNLTCHITGFPTQGKLFVQLPTPLGDVSNGTMVNMSIYHIREAPTSNWTADDEANIYTPGFNWFIYYISNATTNATRPYPKLPVPGCVVYFAADPDYTAPSEDLTDVVGEDRFTFGIGDGRNYSAAIDLGIATLQILNPLRVPSDPEVTTDEDLAFIFEFPGVSYDGNTYFVTVNNAPRWGFFFDPMTGQNISTFPFVIPNTTAFITPQGNRAWIGYAPFGDANGDLESISYFLRSSSGRWKSATTNLKIHVNPINDPPVLSTNYTVGEPFQFLQTHVIYFLLEDPDLNPQALYHAELNTTSGFADAKLGEYPIEGVQITPRDDVELNNLYFIKFTVGDGNWGPSQVYNGFPMGTELLAQDLVASTVFPVSVRCYEKGDETLVFYVSDMDSTFPGPLNATISVNFSCAKQPPYLPSTLNQVPMLIVMWMILASIPIFCFGCVIHKFITNRIYKKIATEDPEPVELKTKASPPVASVLSSSPQAGVPEVSPYGSPVAGPWTKYYTEEGREYYVNSQTNESVWERPAEFSE